MKSFEVTKESQIDFKTGVVSIKSKLETGIFQIDMNNFFCCNKSRQLETPAHKIARRKGSLEHHVVGVLALGQAEGGAKVLLQSGALAVTLDSGQDLERH